VVPVGFFLASYDFITDKKNYTLDQDQKKFLKYDTFFGNEIVASTRRLALMNLFLHNIGDIDSEHIFISPNDSLIAASETRYDYVLANPPFGKKSIKILLWRICRRPNTLAPQRR
jgi:type I restriction enzyme M protein